MDQWIEGVGNEVTVCFLVLSGLLTFSVYKFISSWQPRTTFSNVAQQQSSQESEVINYQMIFTYHFNYFIIELNDFVKLRLSVKC